MLNNAKIANCHRQLLAGSRRQINKKVPGCRPRVLGARPSNLVRFKRVMCGDRTSILDVGEHRELAKIWPRVCCHIRWSGSSNRAS